MEHGTSRFYRLGRRWDPKFNAGTPWNAGRINCQPRVSLENLDDLKADNIRWLVSPSSRDQTAAYEFDNLPPLRLLLVAPQAASSLARQRAPLGVPLPRTKGEYAVHSRRQRPLPANLTVYCFAAFCNFAYGWAPFVLCKDPLGGLAQDFRIVMSHRLR